MKPIIFSSNMVRAILDGRKTMTRRIAKQGKKPPYEAGDVLWVREMWRTIDWDYENDESAATVQFRADMALGIRLTWKEADVGFVNSHWRPSIHLPKKAARIFLQAVTVRSERLQDITEADAIQEGCGIRLFCEHEDGTRELIDWAEPPLVGFKRTWNSLNEKRGYGWDSNPFVWVIDFERVNHDGF